MLDTERFLGKRTEFMETAYLLFPNDALHKVKTYDFLIKTCLRHNTMTESDLEQKVFSEILSAKSVEEIPELVAKAKSESYDWKRRFKHDPAYIIVQGFDTDVKHCEKHLGKYVKKDNLIGKSFFDKTIESDLMDLADGDGAVIVKPNKEIFALKAHLINMNPQQVVEECYPESMIPGYDPSDPKYFGFVPDVNTRHLSALYMSYMLYKLYKSENILKDGLSKDAIVFTLGEKDIRLGAEDDIRMYARGRIIFSTCDAEKETVEKNKQILLDQIREQADVQNGNYSQNIRNRYFERFFGLFNLFNYSRSKSE